MTTARQVAVDVLVAARSANAWASDLVDSAFQTTSLSAPDRRFVTQLVFGVVRQKATLDAALRPFVSRPLHAVEPAILDVLRLGAFQLLFLTHVPRHAAVFETVNLARHVGSPMARGFVNGVLRRIAELITDDFVDQPGPMALPFDTVDPPPVNDDDEVEETDRQRRVPRYRRLTKEVFPDPEKETAAYLAAGFSWPRWLADRWLARFGKEEAFRLGFWFNAPPPLWLRSNRLKTDREGLRLQFTAKTIAAEAGPHPQSLRLEDAVPVRELPGYAEGEFCIQDVSAMAVGAALNPSPGQRVLDLCAAPGGKTTHLAEFMKNRGSIVACDIDSKRLTTVMTLAQRLGVSIIEPYQLDKLNPEPPAGPFDAALVDVPCSNTGVLGRRPEVRWRLRPGEFPELVRLQTRLLLLAFDRVRPGGTIVYSTCSIEPEENTGVVHSVCKAVRGLTREAEGMAIPGRPGDGGYWARLRKG